MSQVLIVRCDMDGSKGVFLKLRVLSIKMYFCFIILQPQHSQLVTAANILICQCALRGRKEKRGKVGEETYLCKQYVTPGIAQ